MIQDATIEPVSPSIPQDGSGAASSQVAAIRTHVWENLKNFTGPSTGFKKWTLERVSGVYCHWNARLDKKT